MSEARFVLILVPVISFTMNYWATCTHTHIRAHARTHTHAHTLLEQKQFQETKCVCAWSKISLIDIWYGSDALYTHLQVIYLHSGVIYLNSYKVTLGIQAMIQLLYYC